MAVFRENKVLVLGVGNDILMDDGIGPKLVNRLKDDFSVDQINFSTLNLGGLEILEFIKDYDEVIIVDAIKTRTGNPGDVYMLTPDDFSETCHLSSFHDVSFLTALRLGEKIGYKLPKSILIIAIEIIEDTCFGKDFSKPLQDCYERIYSEVKSVLLPVFEKKSSLEDILIPSFENGK